MLQYCPSTANRSVEPQQIHLGHVNDSLTLLYVSVTASRSTVGRYGSEHESYAHDSLRLEMLRAWNRISLIARHGLIIASVNMSIV